ncbi:hypothetical protein [Selenomonas noxia]|jgi:hypothetical protein|uniref:hypothetical protein n=1 Tax=Selenomonas noxia TaxID=135083 RepID=UPI00288019BF|nr:hypothetical protein [Selenomonas noxia]
MTRLVRLNEVQYSETEERTAELMAQGFEPEPLEAEAPKVKKPEEPKDKEPKEPKPGKGKSKKTDEGGAEDNPNPEGNEQH